MIKLFLYLLIVFLTNCSFNDSFKKITSNEKLEKIIHKSNDIMSLTFDEYKLFIIEYSKNNEYPNINE